eukprot:Tamp_36051.p1 GENE.Tamp_36051~~Tamp_36051.p1  ORF type:complete len:155 (+),score=43.03 Tamp_36051:24-467(+)
MAEAGAGEAGKIDSAPRIQMMRDLLSSMGVEESDPKVSQQLLEFLHKYVSEVVTDAALYQEHAGKPEVDIDDIRLAVQAKVNGAFAHPAPREFMIEIARAKNAVPLPLIRPGVHLPPPEHCNSFVSMQLAGDAPAGGSAKAKPESSS